MKYEEDSDGAKNILGKVQGSGNECKSLYHHHHHHHQGSPSPGMRQGGR